MDTMHLLPKRAWLHYYLEPLKAQFKRPSPNCWMLALLFTSLSISANDEGCNAGGGVQPSSSLLANETALYLVNPASNSNRQSLLRFVNTTDAENDVEVYAIDDAGNYSGNGPVTFTLAANAAIQLTSQDLENGSPDLNNDLCDGEGKWQLRVRSEGALEAFSLIRTPDGFLTSLVDTVPIENDENLVYFANPGSNTNRQTFLRIVNLSEQSDIVTITGIDDSGSSSSGTVTFSLGPNQSRQITVQDLENGNPALGLTGSLGDGMGKWRLHVSSSLELEVMSLIRTQNGFLTNMSGIAPRNSNNAHKVYFANPGSESARATLLRVVNTSDQDSVITISGVDDAGGIAPGGDVTFELAPNEAKQITSHDLETGSGGLMGMLGDGNGRWYLTISSSVSLEVMSLIRTTEGFLTNLSRTTPVRSGVNDVFVFNPGSNTNRRSWLRIVNDTTAQASVTVSAIDDEGNLANGEVTFDIGSGMAKSLSAQELEQGNSDIVGAVGDGNGKWRLAISSETDLAVQSLLDTPNGFLTNLSRSSSSVSVNPAEQTVVTDSNIATSRPLSLRHIVNAESRNAVCNDGSDAAYYYDAGSGTGEDKWIVYLEGGSLCFNANSCLVRAVTSPDLTSSDDYPDIISMNGIFVTDDTINPDFHNWHLVYARYCSSDLWSGSKAETGEPGEFHFRGYDILVALLEDLQSDNEFGAINLSNAREMVFAGSSAGAGGVIVQLDRVAALVDHLDVKGLPDSLFYDPDVKDFTSIFDPPALIEFQGSILDESCMASEMDTAMCGEPMTAIRHLQTPFFVIADQRDPVINGFFLQADPTAFAAGVREELEVLEQGFSPDAAVHVWVNDSLFYRYRINGVSALDAFSNWYFDRGGVKRVIQQPD